MASSRHLVTLAGVRVVVRWDASAKQVWLDLDADDLADHQDGLALIALAWAAGVWADAFTAANHGWYVEGLRRDEEDDLAAWDGDEP